MGTEAAYNCSPRAQDLLHSCARMAQETGRHNGRLRHVGEPTSRSRLKGRAFTCDVPCRRPASRHAARAARGRATRRGVGAATRVSLSPRLCSLCTRDAPTRLCVDVQGRGHMTRSSPRAGAPRFDRDAVMRNDLTARTAVGTSHDRSTVTPQVKSTHLLVIIRHALAPYAHVLHNYCPPPRHVHKVLECLKQADEDDNNQHASNDSISKCVWIALV